MKFNFKTARNSIKNRDELRNVIHRDSYYPFFSAFLFPRNDFRFMRAVVRVGR